MEGFYLEGMFWTAEESMGLFPKFGCWNRLLSNKYTTYPDPEWDRDSHTKALSHVQGFPLCFISVKSLTSNCCCSSSSLPKGAGSEAVQQSACTLWHRAQSEPSLLLSQAPLYQPRSTQRLLLVSHLSFSRFVSCKVSSLISQALCGFYLPFVFLLKILPVFQTEDWALLMLCFLGFFPPGGFCNPWILLFYTCKQTKKLVQGAFLG